jgi:Xaa-Pro aminopeptidase
MAAKSSRINTPISNAELERRWKAVRERMADRGIDVLVCQANNDYIGGAVRYLSDVPAGNGYPVSLVFPREGDATLIRQGPVHGEQIVPQGGGGPLHGIGRILTTPSYASVSYTRYYDAELIVKALAGFEHATIDFPASAEVSYPTIEFVRREMPDATFVEDWDVIDEVKMVKSAEELELVRRTCAVQDAAMEAAFTALKPGMRESELTAIAEYTARSMGSEQGLYLCSSWQPGESSPFGPPHVQAKVIEKGDIVRLLIECNGPGGYYAELGRMASLGPAPSVMLDECAFTIQAQEYCVSLLDVGVACSEVWNEYNAYMVKNGRPGETRLHCHGQGYDLVERPLIRFDESATISANMNITCHPSYEFGGGFDSWICDNFLITGDGPPELLHRYPQEIVVIGA